jgi:hypothetical protein
MGKRSGVLREYHIGRWKYVDLRKVEVVLKWEKPTNMTKIHNFLGLTGYNRRFIEGLSMIATLLTRLTRKPIKWEWSR